MALMGKLSKRTDDDWRAAEAALAEARSLPGGPERIEALKNAGKLRFAADSKRRQEEQREQRSLQDPVDDT